MSFLHLILRLGLPCYKLCYLFAVPFDKLKLVDFAVHLFSLGFGVRLSCLIYICE